MARKIYIKRVPVVGLGGSMSGCEDEDGNACIFFDVGENCESLLAKLKMHCIGYIFKIDREERTQGICHWRYVKDGNFNTGCGYEVVSDSGELLGNVKFCCSCGRRIVQE